MGRPLYAFAMPEKRRRTPTLFYRTHLGRLHKYVGGTEELEAICGRIVASYAGEQEYLLRRPLGANYEWVNCIKCLKIALNSEG